MPKLYLHLVIVLWINRYLAYSVEDTSRYNQMWEVAMKDRTQDGMICCRIILGVHDSYKV